MTTVKVQDRNSKIVWLFRFLILSLGFWSIADQIFIPDVIRGEVIVANAGHWEFFRGQNAYKKKLSIDSSCRQRSLITSRGCYVGYLLEKFKKNGIKSWAECLPGDKSTCSLAAGIAWVMKGATGFASRPAYTSTWSAKNLKFFFEGVGFGLHIKKGFHAAMQGCSKWSRYKPYCLFGVGQYSFFKYRPVIFGKTPKEIFWGSRFALYEFDPSLQPLQVFWDSSVGGIKSLQMEGLRKSVIDCLKDSHDLDCISKKTLPSDI